jgi:hypothetical protein
MTDKKSNGGNIDKLNCSRKPNKSTNKKGDTK